MVSENSFQIVFRLIEVKVEENLQSQHSEIFLNFVSLCGPNFLKNLESTLI